MESRNEGQGFQKVGSLPSNPTNSVQSLGSIAQTLTEKSRSSGTTGGRSLDSADASSTGTQLSTIGSGKLPAAVSEKMAGADAWSTDKSLIASLPPQVRSSLRSKVNNDFDLIGYELDGQPVGLADAADLVERACQPADRAVVLYEITKCFAVTTARDHDETDMKATLAGMVDGLREFPEDVIRDACRAYARCHKWRPSLSELREFCWPRFRARESLRSTLRRAG
jgi:hypothetical protein